MIVLKLGWMNLKFSEKLSVIAAIVIATLMSYGALKTGNDIISHGVIWPLVLMGLGVQSMFLIGVIRLRALAMNYMFVEVLTELCDAQKKLGKELSPKTRNMLAGFLGDKK